MIHFERKLDWMLVWSLVLFMRAARCACEWNGKEWVRKGPWNWVGGQVRDKTLIPFETYNTEGGYWRETGTWRTANIACKLGLLQCYEDSSTGEYFYVLTTLGQSWNGDGCWPKLDELSAIYQQPK